MLHIQFRGNRLTGSGEEDFRSFFFFIIYEYGGHIGNVTQMSRTNFLFPYTYRDSTRNLALFSQED